MRRFLGRGSVAADDRPRRSARMRASDRGRRRLPVHFRRGYLRDAMADHGVQVIAPDPLSSAQVRDNEVLFIEEFNVQAAAWKPGESIETLLDALRRARVPVLVDHIRQALSAYRVLASGSTGRLSSCLPSVRPRRLRRRAGHWLRRVAGVVRHVEHHQRHRKPDRRVRDGVSAVRPNPGPARTGTAAGRAYRNRPTRRPRSNPARGVEEPKRPCSRNFERRPTSTA